MKCDELKQYEVFVTNPYNTGGSFREIAVLPADKVDEAIAELKGELESRRQAAIDIKLSAEKVLRDLLDCGLIKEWYFNGKFNAVLKADDPHLQIADLKAKLHDAEMRADLAEAANTEYRIDLKNIKDNIAKHARNQYHKHNRQTLRALWLARATIAHSNKYKYHRLACKAEIDPQPHGWSCYINGEVYRTGKMNRMLEPHYWIEIWEEIERKCLKKAKEYR